MHNTTNEAPEWRVIPLPDLRDFEVSRTGDVRVRASAGGLVGRRYPGEKLKQFLLNSGYLAVNVTIRQKRTTVLVHRAVALAFCGEESDTVNHIDGNKLNNCAENLEWCTTSANNHHAIVSGLRKTRLTRENRGQIRDLYFQNGYTQREIASMFGVSDVLISHILTGKCYSFDKGKTRTGGRYLNTNRSYARA